MSGRPALGLAGGSRGDEPVMGQPERLLGAEVALYADRRGGHMNPHVAVT